MQRQSILVLIDLSDPTGETVEAWGSLKEACTSHGWVYSTVVQKKLPLEHKGWKINRCPFRKPYLAK